MKRNNKLRSNIYLFIYHSTNNCEHFLYATLYFGDWVFNNIYYFTDKFLLSGSLYFRKERQTTHQQIDKISGCDKYYEKNGVNGKWGCKLHVFCDCFQFPKKYNFNLKSLKIQKNKKFRRK